MQDPSNSTIENPGSHVQGMGIPGSSLPFGSSFDNHWSSASRENSPSDYVQRQRSNSLSARFRQAGGVNSIDNFARSWQRAACFPEILPRRASLATESDEEWGTVVSEYAGSQSSRPFRHGSDPTRPLLDGGAGAEEDDVLHGSDQSKQGLPSTGILGSSTDRSLGTSYGTISSRVTERRHAIQSHREQQADLDVLGDHNGENLLIKQVQNQNGTRESIVVGKSTVPQTIFNSVNVLIGVDVWMLTEVLLLTLIWRMSVLDITHV
ncbi:hypothetical protein MW887_006980 [Aspergillus wentii]|nr:hypothetical protein MW887_006980 [Aspergillus wentii]